MVAKESRVLALVPARGGSKTIPRKNLRLLSGHPLLAWSIAAARSARAVDRIIVSTDDDEIAAAQQLIAREGLFVQPAAAVPVAALRKLVERGEITPDERVVCLVTGSGLKVPALNQGSLSAEMTTLGRLQEVLAS